MILLRVMLHDSDCQPPYEACPHTAQIHPLAPEEILDVHARTLMIERREDGVIVMHVVGEAAFPFQSGSYSPTNTLSLSEL